MTQSPPANPRRILVVDDNADMTRILADHLGEAGYEVLTSQGGADAIERLKHDAVDLVVTDLRMEGVDGFDVLDAARAEAPHVPVLIMTAFGAVDSAVEAMRRGAYHYFTKPFQLDEVRLDVERALGEQALRDENRALRQLVGESDAFAGMIGHSRPMRTLYQLIERVAPSPATVLVHGESGTGKELVARAIHFRGPRRERAFVAVNCANLPESLLESELFGHARGAFTGAATARRGLFVEADGGTLFLDEIGEMPVGLQARLLRVLTDAQVRPVGSDAARAVDVRLICATNKDLARLVAQGKFREDLYHRINVVAIRTPPLRERIEDVPLLAHHLLARARERNPHGTVDSWTPAALALLGRCSFPGNVRELENTIERLVIVCTGTQIDVAELQEHAPTLLAGPSPTADMHERMPTLRQLESDYIAWVIARCGGNKSRAAEILGIDPSTIHRRERNLGGS